MSPIIWIVIALIIIAACAGGGKKAGAGKGKPVRVDRPHFLDDTDYECSVCGARFRKASAVCPKCGARFSGTREDRTEYEDEEEDEEQAWDEEDGLG